MENGDDVTIFIRPHRNLIRRHEQFAISPFYATLSLFRKDVLSVFLFRKTETTQNKNQEALSNILPESPKTPTLNLGKLTKINVAPRPNNVLYISIGGSASFDARILRSATEWGRHREPGAPLIIRDLPHQGISSDKSVESHLKL